MAKDAGKKHCKNLSIVDHQDHGERGGSTSSDWEFPRLQLDF
jgi:hypothetical protein